MSHGETGPVQASGATGTFTEGPGITAFAGLQPGDRVYLQAWYRDPSGPCGSGFNLSNAIETN